MAAPSWWYYVVGTIDIARCNESAEPSCLSFEHRVVWAGSAEAAYAEGQRELGFHQEPGVIRNDYVFPVRLFDEGAH
jgi:hypothetical protein